MCHKTVCPRGPKSKWDFKILQDFTKNEKFDEKGKFNET